MLAYSRLNPKFLACLKILTQSGRFISSESECIGGKIDLQDTFRFNQGFLSTFTWSQVIRGI